MPRNVQRMRGSRVSQHMRQTAAFQGLRESSRHGLTQYNARAPMDQNPAGISANRQIARAAVPSKALNICEEGRGCIMPRAGRRSSWYQRPLRTGKSTTGVLGSLSGQVKTSDQLSALIERESVGL